MSATVTDLDRALARVKEVERSNRRLFVAVLLVVALFLFVIAFVVIPQRDIRRNGELSVCIARQQARVFGTLGDALKGKPGTPARNARLDQLLTDAGKLKDVDRLCG